MKEQKVDNRIQLGAGCYLNSDIGKIESPDEASAII